MIILGIDPGYDRLGIAIIEKPLKGKEILLHSSCLQTSAKDDIYTRFGQIGAEVARIITEYKPDALAIETLFMSKNQTTAMRVSEVRGIILYQAIQANIAIHEYNPMQIKLAITSDGRSDKERMMKMIPLLLPGLKKDALDDEFDAIAVALTHAATIHSRNFLQK